MGYYAFSKTLPDKAKITTMFSLLESRGRDASGYAFIRDNNLNVNKAAIKSSEMIKTKEWEDLILPRIFIAHTRMKTQGSEKNNANNHPLYSKSGVAIVHNGIIYNDKEIFGKKQRDAQVDSEAVLAVLASTKKVDKIKRLFELVEGSFAVAVIDRMQSDKLILIKKDNPIELYLDTKDDVLYFCSEKEIIQEALSIKQVSKFGFNLGEKNYHHYTMENNHALIITKDGVDTYRRYTSKRFRWFEGPSYSRPYVNNKNTDDMVECPWCLALTRYYGEATINYCEVCGNNLEMEDEIDVFA
ncbi:MAG: hypothetical protein ABI638_04355 [Ignavibacteriota bacterium]